MIRVVGETNDPENSVLEDFKVKRNRTRRVFNTFLMTVLIK